MTYINRVNNRKQSLLYSICRRTDKSEIFLSLTRITLHPRWELPRRCRRMSEHDLENVVVVHLLIFFALRYGSFLVLLVFGNQIIHVTLGLGELHLVHALTSIPVQESLTPEHSRELVANSLEEFLD